MEIRNRFNDKVILEVEEDSLVKLVGADLQYANLRRANLQKANLQEADLRWADLRWADLRWANLREANLYQVDLQKANLREADLQKANLREADLKEADLRGADIRGADLYQADLIGANLDFSCFPLWCGSFNMKIDDRLLSQLLCHIKRLNVSCCSEKFKEELNKLTLYNEFSIYRKDVEKI